MTQPDKPNGLVAALDSAVAHSGKIAAAIALLCAGLAVADFLYHKHEYFSFSELPLFYPLFGFGVYGFVIIVAKCLRPMIKRPEDYYAPYSIDAEPAGKEENNDV